MVAQNHFFGLKMGYLVNKFKRYYISAETFVTIIIYGLVFDFDLEKIWFIVSEKLRAILADFHHKQCILVRKLSISKICMI